MNTHTLGAENLIKRFGKKTVVNGASIEMKTGEIVGLLGPNGAGKTTIFYMIVGFLKPDRGRVFFDHHDISKLPMYKRARLGISYLPQEASVFRRLTVEENIKAILEARGDLDKKEIEEKLTSLLDEMGITHIKKQKAYTLSGGERRRTEIARALAIEPNFLLLDEPFVGIDPIAVYEIKEIIKQLSRKNIGILITDHNARDTLEITSRSYIIDKGTILVEGDSKYISEHSHVREIYLGKNFEL
ncbi:LPS export ABC transporter ATP-binding protein [Spirochaetia bacterium 38H-sp]|uniref:LPS export ABC transporter ATP-binding protein n=1 Tax=Rarispira pelagica TaxID=3141764 RepID=A0ABU9U8Y4_9SPIR